MTSKEVEHWLIDQGFTYVNDGLFPYWKLRDTSIAITDTLVEENPDEAVKFVNEMKDRWLSKGDFDASASD